MLTTAHGSDPEGGYLYWCTPPNNIVPRQTSYYLPIYDPPTYPVNIFNIGNVVAGTNDGYRNGFRLLYLESGQSDLPEDMICPLLHPDDAPSLDDFVGLPVVAYNNYKEASVWQIVTAKTGDGQSPNVYYFELQKSSDSNLAKLWRKVFVTSEPDTSTLDYDYSASNPQADAGSGTPVFLAFTNSNGQTQFVYFGHITNGSTVALGPSYLQYHGDIITALNHLNSYHGYSGSNYLPRYITGSTWGTLTSGLQAYWKLIEANSSRANSVNSSYTLNQTASIGNTWGRLYRYSGDFEHNHTLRTDQTTAFEGNVTIAAWCFIRDFSYSNLGLVTKDDSSDRQWALRNTGYPDCKFVFSINGSSSTVVQSAYAAPGKWHFVLAWYNSSNQTINLRVGTPDDSGALGSTVTTNTGTSMNSGEARVCVGGYDASSNYPWWGRIGPVAIWNRVLSSAEQEALWNGSDGSTYPMVG